MRRPSGDKGELTLECQDHQDGDLLVLLITSLGLGLQVQVLVSCPGCSRVAENWV